jgi:O-antigen ligase
MINKINKILLFTNLFFLQSYLIRFEIGGIPTNLQDILLALNIISFLVLIFQEKRFAQSLKNIFGNKIILSFTVLTAISAVLSQLGIIEILSQTDFIRHLKFAFTALALSSIFLESYKTKEEKEHGLLVLGIGALIFAIYSFYHNMFGFNVAYDNRLRGPLDSAVYLAYYLSPFFLVFSHKTWQMWRDKNRDIKKFRLFLAISFGFLAFIIATRSMGSLAANLAILGTYLFFQKNIISKKFKAILVSALVVVAGITFFTKILPSFSTESTSLNERGEIWTTAKEIIITKPLTTLSRGVGLSQFEAHYKNNVEKTIGKAPLDFNILQPHNHILLFLFHYGFLGIALLALIGFKTVKNFWQIIQKPESADTIKTYSTFVISYFLIHGLIDTPWYKNDLLFLFILFSSLLILNTKTSNKVQ